MMAKDKQDDAGINETDIVESIDELETLIEETDTPPELHDEIPVLNDIVDPAEATAAATTNKIEDIPLERLNKLVDTVDRKLSSELDSYVDLLKDTIKTSIIDELKEELKKGAAQMDSAPSEKDPSDDPSK